MCTRRIAWDITVRNKEKYDKLNISERRGEGFVEFRHYILNFFSFPQKLQVKTL